MIKNYIIVAARNILRHKGHTLINVVGLAVGIATCILIMLWVVDELSFDRFHKDADHIFRLCHELTMSGITRRAPTGSYPMAPAIEAVCPEIDAITRINSRNRTEISYGNNRFFEENILYADSQFFSVFTFPLLRGDPRTALARRHSVVITGEIARKYFHDEDPLGKILRFNGNDEYTVTGVIDRIPSNSHLSFDFLGSLCTLHSDESDGLRQWGTLSTFTYMRTAPGTAAGEIERKIFSTIDERMGKRLKAMGISMKTYLQPLTRIHLYSDFEGEEVATRQGKVSYILLFIGIAIGVMLIACANFINLTTAGSAHRLREIGIRKTFGADRGRLTLQLLTESIVLSLTALILALILMELALPSFNAMAQRNLELNYLAHLWIIPGLVLFAILVGLIAGLYPALSLSSMRPALGLKGLYPTMEPRSVLRRVLVIGQYAVSIALIIGTATIYTQINFLRNKDLGFAADQIMVIRGLDIWPSDPAASLMNEMMQIPGVVQTSRSSAVPGENAMMTNFRPEGHNNEDMFVGVIYADEFTQPTFGLELTAGRNFSSQMGSDSIEALLINEAAARKFGWKDPIGKTISQLVGPSEKATWKPRTVIGVVKDFHYSDLHESIEPLVIIWVTASRFNYLSVCINTTDISRTLDSIRRIWENRAHGEPFDYFFLDQHFAEQFRTEERLGKIAVSFSLLAIFVACLGLFGMASHAARRRTKEIGVRKVLGATISGIAAQLVAEPVKYVLIANVVAWPIAFYIMNRWLQNFAYRINVSPAIFVFSGALALTLAVVTVAFQAIRAACANPVDSLKYE